MKKFNLNLIYFLAISFFLISSSAQAANRYIRTDGGTGTQCTGLADAAYDGSGTGEACAVNHPNWVFPPIGNASPFSTARAAQNGDTVVIGAGSYRMGQPTALAPGIDANININCGAGDTAACVSGEIPDGVTVVGCSISGCGCSNERLGVVTCSSTRPELWGAGNTNGILNVSNSSGVTIKDLEITDRESRGYNIQEQPSLSCESPGGGANEPTLKSAYVGILSHNAVNLNVVNVNVHGLCAKAFFGASLVSPTFTGFVSEYNAGIGLDNDSNGSCTTCGWTGTITIKNSSISRNGCIENWQSDGTIMTGGCYGGGDQAGYGDGIGLARTAGNWVITDSDISHNSSDGADFLYHNRPPYSGGTLVFRRNRFEGNAGNQLKISNASTTIGNFIIGNCLYFRNQSITQVGPGNGFENCRGAGAPLSIAWRDNTAPIVYQNTITSNGDTTITTDEECSGASPPLIRNNIIIGGRDGIQDTSVGFVGGSNDWTDIYYNAGTNGAGAGCCNGDDGCGGTTDSGNAPTFTNNFCVGMFKDTNECTGTNTIVSPANQATMDFAGTILQGDNTASNGSPGGGITTYATYSTEQSDYAGNFYLQASSPAVGAADEDFGDSLDFNSATRSSPWDVGAVENSSVPTPICGDGTIDPGEQCDGLNLNSQDCGDRGFDGGTLSCSSGCTFNTTACVFNCGNGTIQSPEQCDGANINSKTCATEGFTGGGAITCNSNCTVNTSACSNIFCGDEIVEGSEECDGADLNSHSCISEGFDAGDLNCSPSCTLDTAACITVTCGNGTIGSGEQCDGSNLSGQTCITQGFAGGTLDCDGSCQFDTSGCLSSVCGNGTIETSEQCDGSALNSQTCTTLGFNSGTLSCNNCLFNTSGCAYNPNTGVKMIIGGAITAGGVGSIQ